MKKLITFLLLASSAWAACTGSSPTWTSTPDNASLTTCLASASRGDTINVSAGTATWTGTYITITKGVTLQGAGVGQTIIINHNANVLDPVFVVGPDATAIANSENIKIDGFTFDGDNINQRMLYIGGAGVSGTKPYRYVIVTNNKFQNEAAGAGVIYTQGGQVRGVIANNTFDRCEIIIRPLGGDDTTEWTNTNYNNFAYGSADNLYFESNTIKWSSAYASAGNTGWIESGQGGRVVVRHNTWDYTNVTYTGGQNQEFWDVHGFQNFSLVGPTIGQTSTMIVEYYLNEILHGPNVSFRLINLRGSWAMVWGNRYTGGGSPGLEVNQYYNGVAGGSGCAADITPTPVGYIPEVNNSYIFDNLVNGTLSAMVPGSIGNGCGIAENKDYWNQTNSFTGATGIGRGVRASRPATCTTGVGYWATDLNVLDKCTSTNTWTSAYYTPYTYPHPLAGPTATISATSIAFGNQANGTTSAATVLTLTNNGAATLNISSIANPTGTNAGDFAKTTTCASTLAPSATCNISVTFTPSAVATRSASIVVTADDAASPQTISLTGTGTGIPSPINSFTASTMTLQVGSTYTLTYSSDGSTCTLDAVTVNCSGATTTPYSDTVGSSTHRFIATGVGGTTENDLIIRTDKKVANIAFN